MDGRESERGIVMELAEHEQPLFVSAPPETRHKAGRAVAAAVKSGVLVRGPCHELDLRFSWSGEPCRRIGEAEEATAKIEAQIKARPPFIRQWEAERDLLRSLASDVEMGRLGRLTVAQIEEHEERRAKERRMFG